MIAASSHARRTSDGGKVCFGERTFLALSGKNSVKQKTVCIRAQLCRMAEEIIICWNAIGLEFFRSAVGQGRPNHSLLLEGNAGWSTFPPIDSRECDERTFIRLQGAYALSCKLPRLAIAS